MLPLERKKRCKRCRAVSDTYPPDVWDNLSHIALTRKALREFDRRTQVKALKGLKYTSGVTRRALRSYTRRLQQYARRGAPDLSRLRSYADRPIAKPNMSKQSFCAEEHNRESGLQESSLSGRMSTTGTYDPLFEQIIIENGVFPEKYEDVDGEVLNPSNIAEIRERLALPRRSLSPSRFDEDDFKQFIRTNLRAPTELDVATDVIPNINGQEGRHFSASGLEFNNLEPFHRALKTPKPDRYYGAMPGQIDAHVRADIGQYIVPSTATSRPAAPNHFLEYKGPSGRGDVLQRQAMYDGAVGARGMFHLQNYGKETPTYDGNAYSTVATYAQSSGTLRLYATHPRRSATGRTEYHMTALRSVAIIDSVDSFRQGVAAYRNARDLSKEYRDCFIAQANAVVHLRKPSNSLCSRPVTKV